MYNPFETISPEDALSRGETANEIAGFNEGTGAYDPAQNLWQPQTQANDWTAGNPFQRQPDNQQQSISQPLQPKQPSIQQANYAPSGGTQSILSGYAAHPRVRLAGVDPDFERRIHTALQAAKQATGVDPRLSSAFRTPEDQREIWGRAYNPETGKTRFAAAPPGHSWHERGKAVDIAPGAALDWLRSPDPQNPGRRIGERYGISFFRGDYDPVHAQPIQGWKAAYKRGGRIKFPAQFTSHAQKSFHAGLGIS